MIKKKRALARKFLMRLGLKPFGCSLIYTTLKGVLQKEVSQIFF